MDETEKVEEYLAEVVERLFDVVTAMEAGKMGAEIEKADLTRVGRGFAYQQGIIDFSREVLKYATGELNLKTVVEELMRAKRNLVEMEVEQQVAAPVSSGMEVG